MSSDAEEFAALLREIHERFDSLSTMHDDYMKFHAELEDLGKMYVQEYEAISDAVSLAERIKESKR
jgi:hypothetical protein